MKDIMVINAEKIIKQEGSCDNISCNCCGLDDVCRRNKHFPKNKKIIYANKYIKNDKLGINNIFRI